MPMILILIQIYVQTDNYKKIELPLKSEILNFHSRMPLKMFHFGFSSSCIF